jgi:hypothetical protein
VQDTVNTKKLKNAKRHKEADTGRKNTPSMVILSMCEDDDKRKGVWKQSRWSSLGLLQQILQCSQTGILL